MTGQRLKSKGKEGLAKALSDKMTFKDNSLVFDEGQPTEYSIKIKRYGFKCDRDDKWAFSSDIITLNENISSVNI